MSRFPLFAALCIAAACPLLAESPAKSCRVTGIVISTKAETRAQPAENQFRIRVLESPWGWQVGSSMPVTAAEPVTFGNGDTVEIDCDFAKATRKGRFFGLAARKLTFTPDRPVPISD